MDKFTGFLNKLNEQVNDELEFQIGSLNLTEKEMSKLNKSENYYCTISGRGLARGNKEVEVTIFEDENWWAEEGVNMWGDSGDQTSTIALKWLSKGTGDDTLIFNKEGFLIYGKLVYKNNSWFWEVSDDMTEAEDNDQESSEFMSRQLLYFLKQNNLKISYVVRKFVNTKFATKIKSKLEKLGIKFNKIV